LKADDVETPLPSYSSLVDRHSNLDILPQAPEKARKSRKCSRKSRKFTLFTATRCKIFWTYAGRKWILRNLAAVSANSLIYICQRGRYRCPRSRFSAHHRCSGIFSYFFPSKSSRAGEVHEIFYSVENDLYIQSEGSTACHYVQRHKNRITSLSLTTMIQRCAFPDTKAI
jgi:hypothetical protein